MDFTEAVQEQNGNILEAKRKDCENTLTDWGFPKCDEHTTLLINAALLTHLESSKASDAIKKAKEDKQCCHMAQQCYKKSQKMRDDIYPNSGTVHDVIQYLIMDLDNFIFQQ